ncbi:hypothetical protein [Serinibacter salmoneus]|uniref:Uncharacterized protein n=1 Tax=Serinibacter salmoneus TaxID=556530 RepID=A0A2A9CZP9_9MICO|nr:hypothetical protein [Serinibacter salmoneus]PFG19172.1 hypothetical protein ATL40_0729 [Serinibacter salmoneus]
MPGSPQHGDRADHRSQYPLPGGARRPVTVWVVVALLGLEALTLVVLGVSALLAAGGDGQVGGSVVVAVFLLVLALILGALALSLWRLRRWARGACVAWSILVVLVGGSQFGVNPLVATLIVLAGAAGVFAASARPTREALGID